MDLTLTWNRRKENLARRKKENKTKKQIGQETKVVPVKWGRQSSHFLFSEGESKCKHYIGTKSSYFWILRDKHLNFWEWVECSASAANFSAFSFCFRKPMLAEPLYEWRAVPGDVHKLLLFLSWRLLWRQVSVLWRRHPDW